MLSGNPSVVSGPQHEPTLIRLYADELKKESAGEAMKEKIYDAIATMPPDEEPVKEGKPGISKARLATALNCSEKTAGRAIDLLLDEQRVIVTGKMAKQKKLYGVKPLSFTRFC